METEQAAQVREQQDRKPKLVIRQASKTFLSGKKEMHALLPVSLEIAEGEFWILTGPSGCGKSTLLNMVAGFIEPDGGEILLDGKRVSGPDSERMMMFQEHALFPWLTVLDNVLFGLEWKPSLSAKERVETARFYLDMTGMTRFENAMPHELSGGMKQRVALARALAPNPSVILMDEPFASLDALTRERLYEHTQAVVSKTKKTVIFVTHNVREAACLGDRVAVFTARPGKIKSEIAVPLPRPRSFYDPEVSRYAGKILDELKSELEKESV